MESKPHVYTFAEFVSERARAVPAESRSAKLKKDEHNKTYFRRESRIFFLSLSSEKQENV